MRFGLTTNKPLRHHLPCRGKWESGKQMKYMYILNIDKIINVPDRTNRQTFGNRDPKYYGL